MKILIVDDYDENLYMLSSLLAAHGHDIITAANGSDAFAILKEDGADLIISDILMPVMDGFQLCRLVKGDKVLRSIPFIIYTATYTSLLDQELAMKIGADRFIEKPCEPERFIEAIREITLTAPPDQDNAPAMATQPEEEILKLYNEQLVRKLEQKMLQAEQELQSRLKAEKALCESESRFRLFAETAPVGVIISDRNQNALYISKKFTSLFGYTLQDVPNIEAWFRLAYPDEALRIQVQNIWQAAVDEAQKTQSEIKPLEFPVSCKDGSIRDIEFRMSISGEFHFVVLTDISLRKEMDKQREALQEQLFMAQKMESIGRLAGGVAHDFNNMLSVIIGYTGLAMKKMDPSDRSHADLNEVLKAAMRSADITRQLLAFARKQSINPKVLDLNDTVESMLKLLRRLIGEDISLTWIPVMDLWPVQIDPTQIDQVLANLAVNARDAIINVGKIVIETANVTIRPDQCTQISDGFPGEFIMLAVSDTGCGIDNDTLTHIFEPFFTTRAEGSGTGLGLSMVYGIVKQNGGFITVYSEPGNGTTFKIYLPRYHGDFEPNGMENPREIPKGHGETILVAEDEPSILNLTESLLLELGYSVLTASTTAEAIHLAQDNEKTIRLLISDVVMPDMNGQDLAREIRLAIPDLKVLFMSGYTDNVVLQRGGVLQKDDFFLQKPFSQMDLAIQVKNALKATHS